MVITPVIEVRLTLKHMTNLAFMDWIIGKENIT